jgi:N-acetylmuramic acid 6-phosphate etherase
MHMDHLETEARNPASANLDELTALEIVQLMNAEDARVIPGVASQADNIARAIDLIADRLRSGGRLIYVGAGTSGRLGVLDATECPPTFNSPPGQVIGLIAGGPEALTRAVEGAEDKPESAEHDLQAIQLSANDAVVGIATSGRTPYVLGALRYARAQNAATIGLTCNSESELHALCDLSITPVVGPEVLSGSTRLKAGTATKLVLNMLTTGAMVRLGKAYGNLMVDLRATNSKLRARTNRIVRIVTGLNADAAEEVLEQCGGELKTALVSQLAKTTPADARARLQAAGGRIREALGRTTGLEVAADLHLGIDGGGTHTVALLASDGTTLGRGEARASNVNAVGLPAALRALDEAVAAAFDAAGRPRVTVARACLGLAGAGRPPEQNSIREWAVQVALARHVDVTTDIELVIAAGTADGWGLAIVAGTGSIAYGRTTDGRSARAGGWGYLLGDEGSGYALSLAGLNAVARAADGRAPATALTERFLHRLGLREPQDLVHAIYQGHWTRAALAALAPIVLDAADEGDAVAECCAAEGAGRLAEMAATVARRLHMTGVAVPVALSGGTLLGSESYRERVLERLGAESLVVQSIHLVPEPAAGALRLAARMSAEC